MIETIDQIPCSYCGKPLNPESEKIIHLLSKIGKVEVSQEKRKWYEFWIPSEMNLCPSCFKKKEERSEDIFNHISGVIYILIIYGTIFFLIYVIFWQKEY